MLSSWRAILMPGAGLGAQLPLLRGLAVLEREGVDAAVAYFRALAAATEDEEDLELIDEQIVSMLLYGERWAEGIEHYERRFRPRYAVHRPPLALGLVRAYGEAGRMDRAAGLLRWMEESPLAGDPHAAEVLGQARLTFLAFAGASRAVAWVAAHLVIRDTGIDRLVALALALTDKAFAAIAVQAAASITAGHVGDVVQEIDGSNAFEFGRQAQVALLRAGQNLDSGHAAGPRDRSCAVASGDVHSLAAGQFVAIASNPEINGLAFNRPATNSLHHHLSADCQISTQFTFAGANGY